MSSIRPASVGHQGGARAKTGRLALPRASVIITNYNYARFLPRAIDSALRQTYPNTEVIVVDDGSTDGSRDIIASYGGRIVAVLKANGGMGSSFNAGFSASRGEIVCFLDADDIFSPEKVAAVVEAARDVPEAVLIYHQLQGINIAEDRIGPPWPRRVLRGDIKEQVERSGGWWPNPVTTGLCYRRSYLERVFPLPENEFRVCAEAYLTGLAPFLGPVVGIARPLASYRRHEHNYWQQQFADRQAGCRRKADQYAKEFRVIKATLQERLGIDTAMSLDDHYLYQYYLRGGGHPVPLSKAAFALARCRSLPLAIKMRDLAKMLTDRL